MSDQESLSDCGYSPYLLAVLEVAGEELNVAALGPGKLTIRNAKALPACRAVLRVTIDQDVDARVVDLYEGIDPQRREQPFRVVESGPSEYLRPGVSVA
jgi:hypothetical protein